MAVRQRVTVPFTGHVIGEGFNSKTVERVGKGLNPGTIGEDKMAPGQSASFKFLMLTSQDRLERELNVGAQIDVRYGLFSGGAKFSFAENSAVNLSSTYILASCVITNALRSGFDFKPTDLADRLIGEGDKAGWMTSFGDRFCQALHTGGEFHSLVRVTSSDTEHQRRISASLHAELNGFVSSGSFKGSLEMAQKDKSSHTEIDIQVHQTGGVGAQVQIPGSDADRIRAHMNRFAEAAHENAAAFQAELVTYDTLALPFPSEEEQEERRAVLEDCLARRQKYWSAISELDFAQTKEAPLIFENLPPKDALVALQNEFRRVLNELNSHARKVADGKIEPELFIATNEPVLPVLKRRTTGSFGVWWTRAKQNDATLLQDERILINAIASEAAAGLSVPLDQAPTEAVEQAANLIERITVQTPDQPQLRSMASLPKMIDAPLLRVRGQQNAMRTLEGLESFTRVEFLAHTFGRLSDIGALSAAAGLKQLVLFKNEIEDLSPLSALIELEGLFVEGNRIETLEPIRKLTELRCVQLASEDITEAIGISESTGFMDNPIVDASALGALPHLACPITTADRLAVKVFDSPNTGFDIPVPTLIQEGQASRVGKSHRFEFTPDDGAEVEQMVCCGVTEFFDLTVLPAPIVAYSVSLPSRGTALGSTPPGNLAASLPPAELVDLWFGESDFQFEAGRLVGSEMPSTVVELTPA